MLWQHYFSRWPCRPFMLSAETTTLPWCHNLEDMLQYPFKASALPPHLRLGILRRAKRGGDREGNPTLDKWILSGE